MSGFEPPASRSRSERATKLRHIPLRGPPRIRTENLLRARELLLPIGASSPDYGAAPGTALSPGVAWLSSAAPLGRGRMAPAADAHAMVFSMCKHVHPQVVLRWDGRIRTCGARLWRPPLSPLSYIPLQLSENESRPSGSVPGAAYGALPIGLHRSHLAQARVCARIARHGVLLAGARYPDDHDGSFLIPAKRETAPVRALIPGGGSGVLPAGPTPRPPRPCACSRLRRAISLAVRSRSLAEFSRAFPSLSYRSDDGAG
jgi:hypothetical protein